MESLFQEPSVERLFPNTELKTLDDLNFDPGVVFTEETEFGTGKDFDGG